MNRTLRTLYRPLLALLFLLITTTAAFSGEIDDSALFVDAFNAFQQKDYLLALEKCEQLQQVFPDSPLRDVVLLLTARASLKSGDNERAAKSVIRFTSEFPESSLGSSIEDELNGVAKRLHNGEKLTPDRALQASALKVRADNVARERAIALKAEMERAAKIKAEQERQARIKFEAERRERERLLAEKLAKASIQLSIALPAKIDPVPVNGKSVIPVEISNRGKQSEEFLLSIAAPEGSIARFDRAEGGDGPLEKIQLAAGELLKGTITFSMPAAVDGARSMFSLKAVSSKFSDIIFQKSALITTSGPLVRAVAKFSKAKVVSGESVRFRLAVLNAGSLSAKDLTVRIQLPPEIEIQGVATTTLKKELDNRYSYQIDRLEMGKLVDLNLEVTINAATIAGQELRGTIEVENGELLRKDTFNTSSLLVVTQTP